MNNINQEELYLQLQTQSENKFLGFQRVFPLSSENTTWDLFMDMHTVCYSSYYIAIIVDILKRKYA